MDERLYVQQDANANVTALVNTSGSVVERYAYDPYGKPTFLNASWGTLSSSAYASNTLFQGGRFDTAASLYNFRFRMQSPTQGHWLQVDPASFAGGDVNLYRTVGNSPVCYVDPIELLTSLNTPTGLGVMGWIAAGCKLIYSGLVSIYPPAMMMASYLAGLAAINPRAGDMAFYLFQKFTEQFSSNGPGPEQEAARRIEEAARPDQPPQEPPPPPEPAAEGAMKPPKGPPSNSVADTLNAMGRPNWANTAGGFVNWLRNLQAQGHVLTQAEADAIIAEAQRLGVSVRLDPPHPGTNWNVPHLNIGSANVHLQVPGGYTHPTVPTGSATRPR